MAAPDNTALARMISNLQREVVADREWVQVSPVAIPPRTCCKIVNSVPRAVLPGELPDGITALGCAAGAPCLVTMSGLLRDALAAPRDTSTEFFLSGTTVTDVRPTTPGAPQVLIGSVSGRAALSRDILVTIRDWGPVP